MALMGAKANTLNIEFEDLDKKKKTIKPEATTSDDIMTLLNPLQGLKKGQTQRFQQQEDRMSQFSFDSSDVDAYKDESPIPVL